MKYGDNCWPDIEASDKDKIVVVPLASLEQHGHHSPLLTDTYLCTAVAERVEALMPDDIYLLPTLWVGASDHHLEKPGTVKGIGLVLTTILAITGLEETRSTD